jgi:hypothetical protein
MEIHFVLTRFQRPDTLRHPFHRLRSRWELAMSWTTFPPQGRNLAVFRGGCDTTGADHRSQGSRPTTKSSHLQGGARSATHEAVCRDICGASDPAGDWRLLLRPSVLLWSATRPRLCANLCGAGPDARMRADLLWAGESAMPGGPGPIAAEYGGSGHPPLTRRVSGVVVGVEPHVFRGQISGPEPHA